MNYTHFIVKMVTKPEQSSFKNGTLVTEFIGKFYQFRNNPHTICKLSFWGRPAYEVLKYYKTSEYVLVEGYISFRKSTFEKFKTTTYIEISSFKVHPFPLKTDPVKKDKKKK